MTKFFRTVIAIVILVLPSLALGNQPLPRRQINPDIPEICQDTRQTRRERRQMSSENRARLDAYCGAVRELANNELAAHLQKFDQSAEACQIAADAHIHAENIEHGEEIQGLQQDIELLRYTAEVRVLEQELAREIARARLLQREARALADRAGRLRYTALVLIYRWVGDASVRETRSDRARATVEQLGARLGLSSWEAPAHAELPTLPAQQLPEELTDSGSSFSQAGWCNVDPMTWITENLATAYP